MSYIVTISVVVPITSMLVVRHPQVLCHLFIQALLQKTLQSLAGPRFKVSLPVKSVDLLDRARYILFGCLLEQHRGALLMFVLVAQLWSYPPFYFFPIQK